MTSINELMPSKFLTKENVTPDVLVTISNVRTEEITDNGAQKRKAIIYFNEFSQGLILNQTNKETLILIFGTDQIESWIGKTVTLFNDRSVAMHGQLTGGVRIRIPQSVMQNQERAVNPSTAQAYDHNGNPIY